VPEGRVFLLGDNRHASEDSRSLLGAPGGGMILESMVVGRVDAIVWPPGRRDGVPAGDGR
jgi:signal peptidase I